MASLKPALFWAVFSAILLATVQATDTAPTSDSAKVYPDGDAAKQKCEALATSFKSSSLELSSVFSQYWPVGSNPSLELLSETYPEGVLPKKPKLANLLRGVGPDIDNSRDAGYGWNADTRVSAHGPLGGLPAFCRFGAFIKTSEETQVLSEVWMPLASDSNAPLAPINAADYPTNSTPIQLGPGESYIKAPTWLTDAIAANGTLKPNQKDGTYLRPSKKKANGTAAGNSTDPGTGGSGSSGGSGKGSGKDTTITVPVPGPSGGDPKESKNDNTATTTTTGTGTSADGKETKDTTKDTSKDDTTTTAGTTGSETKDTTKDDTATTGTTGASGNGNGKDAKDTTKDTATNAGTTGTGNDKGTTTTTGTSGSEKETKDIAPGTTGSGAEKETKDTAPGTTGSGAEKETKDTAPGTTGSEKKTEDTAAGTTGSGAEKETKDTATTPDTTGSSSDKGTKLVSSNAMSRRMEYEVRRDRSYLTGEEVLGSPEQGWNGRLMHLGNGGQRGFVPFPTMKQAMSRYGFAVSGTNTGHFSTTAGVSWVNGTQYDQTLKDWAGFSTHVTKALADEVIPAFYSDAAKTSFYAGCSVGGKTGLASAQQYPGSDPNGKKDFDGILAGSPAVDFNRMNAGQINFQKHHRKKNVQAQGEWFAINYTQYPVHETILAECDTLDGVQDGVVSFTRQCKPNFEKYLLCGQPGAKYGGSPDTCLNTTQIANLRSMYEDFTLDGELVYPAYPYTWEQRSVGLVGMAAKAGGWFALAVLKRPDLEDANEFDYWNELTLDVIKQGDNTDWDGAVTDLSPAFNAGTKIISYHGLSDITISPYNTAAYYDNVGKAVEGKIKGQLSDYYQHYEIPGMSHCRDGAGPWHFGGPTQEDGGNRPYRFDTRHDMTLKLVAWVEQNHSEKFSVGAHYDSKSRLLNEDPLGGEPQKWDPTLPTTFSDFSYGLTFTRKLCPYPEVAHYVGGPTTGPAAWRSFKCKAM